MPEEVVKNFESGAFICNVTDRSVHSLALDEAHEMLVNKDFKTTVVRLTKEYMDWIIRIIHYYPVRQDIKKANTFGWSWTILQHIVHFQHITISCQSGRECSCYNG